MSRSCRRAGWRRNKFPRDRGWDHGIGTARPDFHAPQISSVTRVQGGCEEDPFAVIQHDKRKLQTLAKAIFDGSVIAPIHVRIARRLRRSSACRRRLDGKELGSPWQQRLVEFRHAGERQSDKLRTFNERVEIAIRLAQLWTTCTTTAQPANARGRHPIACLTALFRLGHRLASDHALDISRAGPVRHSAFDR